MQFGESSEQYQSRLLQQGLLQQADAKLAQSLAAAAASPLSPNLDCSNLLKPESAIVLLKAVISSGLHPSIRRARPEILASDTPITYAWQVALHP